MNKLQFLIFIGVLFLTGCTQPTLAPSNPSSSAKIVPLIQTTELPDKSPSVSPSLKTATPSPKPSPTIKLTLKPTARPTLKAAATLAPAINTTSGATAKCVDGTLSYSAHRQGTCSHHGGVAIWY